MTDRQLITGCLQEDASSQRKLYERFLPYVYGICRRFQVAPDQVKDIIQEIFIEVFLNLVKYKSEKGALKYWIKTIAIRKIIKELKKKKMLTVQWEEIIHEPVNWDLQIQHLDAEYVIHLISSLPDGYRAVFNLYVIDGYTHKEIAKMLDIEESSSRSQLTRAKKMLQERLKLVNKE